ncbi:DUF2480 family protein [Niabella sp. CC-SYL272]|uniref:DUF2480 family protein n=1 Tax=Niabella agricola TaxID=2891571 RepID=UPI001F474DD0|nr:DUF2480 family protein [Niabella agricola]MCF3111984.1 DUF2480 family protein [Niabella agricola]
MPDLKHKETDMQDFRNIIPNKVALSGITGVNLLDYAPDDQFLDFDITPFCYRGLMLKEKEFKTEMEAVNWAQYMGSCVSVYCSSGAILPQWVWMLIAAKLQPFAKSIIFGSTEVHRTERWIANIEAADFSSLKGKKTTLRANPAVPEAVYMKATEKLMPLVPTLMYGEPGLPKVIYKLRKSTTEATS